MILLIGFAYIVLLGGLFLLRREGLSIRFALEALGITGVASGLVAVTGFFFHPVLFLLLLYLITLRVRLLVDLGTAFARRGQLSRAGRIYALAARLWPDKASLLALQVNRGTAFLQAGKLDEAVALFTEVLSKSGQGYLGIKYESAAHYNLGVAYLRQSKDALAVREFNVVLETWPVSEYARHATAALERHRKKTIPASDKEKP